MRTRTAALLTLLALASSVAACEVEETGEPPEVQVEEGELPEVDVDAPDVRLEEDTIVVPTPTTDPEGESRP